ncbi:MAG TPA: peptidase M3, partial [Planctomycetaceae bacterium]|nr:peptidase M3 [Planctomycetaceae bacterium]
DELLPLQARALQVALLAYQRNQLPPDLLKQMVDREAEIERLFGTFRAELDGRRFSNNDLLEWLRIEADSAKRRRIWQALKQVGRVVAPRLIELAEIRNKAARTLGFANFWEMSIRLQEHDPEQLLVIFDELERLTRGSFIRMKAELDDELARRFGMAADQIMPWHYDNPFFQAPPPSEKVDLDAFFRDKTKEQIVAIARRYYRRIGLPADDVLARSDLFEREGKDQHAFCMDIDRAGDVRILCNIKPTAEWMATTLHELGHAVYDLHIDRSLPFNLRRPAHAFTTEGVAMLFGAKVQEPAWLVAYAEADASRVSLLANAISEQRRREQLIFARWTMVMLHFEKALYENPRRDLNRLWWDYVEQYQRVPRPPDRNQPDWAAKPHSTVAPVYYHNYMLGELFASQLRHRLADLAKRDSHARQDESAAEKLIGDVLKSSVFRPGASQPWPRFVESATGEPLTARYFAAEVQ